MSIENVCAHSALFVCLYIRWIMVEIVRAFVFDMIKKAIVVFTSKIIDFLQYNNGCLLRYKMNQ